MSEIEAIKRAKNKMKITTDLFRFFFSLDKIVNSYDQFAACTWFESLFFKSYSNSTSKSMLSFYVHIEWNGRRTHTHILINVSIVIGKRIAEYAPAFAHTVPWNMEEGTRQNNNNNKRKICGTMCWSKGLITSKSHTHKYWAMILLLFYKVCPDIQPISDRFSWFRCGSYSGHYYRIMWHWLRMRPKNETKKQLKNKWTRYHPY